VFSVDILTFVFAVCHSVISSGNVRVYRHFLKKNYTLEETTVRNLEISVKRA